MNSSTIRLRCAISPEIGPPASVTTAPTLGTCYAWAPDGSAAKVADAGANILYRYKNSVLTNEPLWNLTADPLHRGEFPHGALVTGVNDIAGQPLFDVHKRLNVGTNGCSFPAGYAGLVAANPPPAAPRGVGLR